MPLIQTDLADAPGQTAIHINRTLQALRSSGMLSQERQRPTLLDPDRLTAHAEFDPACLHFGAAHDPNSTPAG